MEVFKMKTFYSVTYSGLFSGLKTAWFIDEANALYFSQSDYRDKPIRHQVSNYQDIADMNQWALETEYELAQLSREEW